MKDKKKSTKPKNELSYANQKALLFALEPLKKDIKSLTSKLNTLIEKTNPLIFYNEELQYANQERRIVISCDASYNEVSKQAAIAYVVVFPDKTIKEFSSLSNAQDSNLAELDAIYMALQFVVISAAYSFCRGIEIRTDNLNVKRCISDNKELKKNHPFNKKASIIRNEIIPTLKTQIFIYQKPRKSTYGLQQADILSRNKLQSCYPSEDC